MEPNLFENKSTVSYNKLMQYDFAKTRYSYDEYHFKRSYRFAEYTKISALGQIIQHCFFADIIVIHKSCFQNKYMWLYLDVNCWVQKILFPYSLSHSR